MTSFRSVTSSILAFFALANLHSQVIVTGRVLDAATGEPMAGVYVIYRKNTATSTGIDGKYQFSPDTGRIHVTWQFIGYIAHKEDIIVHGGKNELPDIRLETETTALAQVIVSADRIERKLSDLTVSVDVIKSDFLERNHIAEAQELITKTPGIEVLDGQASIRGGSGFSYGVGSRVLALVDGLPLLSGDAGSIRWQYLPVENISQVEIIKGASSVLYGTSALDGIINFRTSDAGNIPVTSVFNETGLYLSPRNKNWKWWKGPRFSSMLSFSHLSRTGNTDVGLNINLFTDNSYRKYNDESLGKLGLRLKHFSKKFPGLTYGANLTAGLTSKTDFILWKNADNALIQDTSSVSSLDGRFISVDPFISMSKPGIYRHDLRMRLQYNENRFPVRPNNDASALSLYSEYQGWFHINDLINITGGAAFTLNSVNSNFFGNHQGINAALFGQAEYSPVERLKIVAGVRAEENILDSKTDRLVPVFRTGINLKLAEFTFFRASFGQGYRFPSIAEKYASTALGSVTIFPNPNVAAESGWSTEAGLRQGIKIGSVTGYADLAVFYSQNKDLIEYIFGLYPLGLGFMADNVEHSRIYGTELEFSFSRTFGKARVHANGGYTYLYPVEFNAYTGKNTDTWLKYRRKNSAKLSMGVSWKKIESEFSLYLRSKILNIDDVFLSPASRETILPGFYDYWLSHNKSYIVLDISAGYNINRWMTVSLALKNSTNTEYMGRPGDIQAPRSLCVRLSGKF